MYLVFKHSKCPAVFTKLATMNSVTRYSFALAVSIMQRVQTLLFTAVTHFLQYKTRLFCPEHIFANRSVNTLKPMSIHWLIKIVLYNFTSVHYNPIERNTSKIIVAAKLISQVKPSKNSFNIFHPSFHPQQRSKKKKKSRNPFRLIVCGNDSSLLYPAQNRTAHTHTNTHTFVDSTSAKLAVLFGQ